MKYKIANRKLHCTLNVSGAKWIFYYLLFTILNFISFDSSAQDTHFSQYYATPTLLNPANTGNFNGQYRVGLNYRTQWSSVTVPWRTFDLYGDLALMKGSFKKKYFAGVGLVLLKDRAGDGNLSVTKAIASGAFHFEINKSKSHTFSTGASFGFIQKTLDWNKLYFNNQWTDAEFDTGLPSMENYAFNKINYLDMSLGFLYQNASEQKYNYYASLALHHVSSPKETFYSDGANKIKVRPVVTAGFTYMFAKVFSISPSFDYMTERKASETLAGLMIGYDLSEYATTTVKVFAGFYNRFRDAVIPTIGAEYGPWRSFINYDINYSELKPFSNGRGAFEISLVYVGGGSKLRNIIDIPCPRF